MNNAFEIACLVLCTALETLHLNQHRLYKGDTMHWLFLSALLVACLVTRSNGQSVRRQSIGNRRQLIDSRGIEHCRINEPEAYKVHLCPVENLTERSAACASGIAFFVFLSMTKEANRQQLCFFLAEGEGPDRPGSSSEGSL